MKQILSILFLLTIITCTSDNREVYFGCIDLEAANYDILAIIDDGSCLYNQGCTDQNACNYNEFAIVDDGNCDYASNIAYIGINESNSIYNIISNKCLGCHQKGNVISGLSLETYDDVSSYVTIGVINNTTNPMPPDGSVQLTDCEKLKIENWINNGYEAAQ